MADKTIGSLPSAASLDDDSLLVAEQQGAAVSVSGALFKQFARESVGSYVSEAQAAAEAAEQSAQEAAGSLAQIGTAVEDAETAAQAAKDAQTAAEEASDSAQQHAQTAQTAAEAAELAAQTAAQEAENAAAGAAAAVEEKLQGYVDEAEQAAGAAQTAAGTAAADAASAVEEQLADHVTAAQEAQAAAEKARDEAQAIAGGDFMEKSVYDPQGKGTDVFQYAEDAADTAVAFHNKSEDAHADLFDAKSGKAEAFTVALSAGSWDETSQTVSDSRILKAGYAYAVAPDSGSFEAYGSAMIYAENISADGGMVFHCGEAPTADLTVNILRMESSSDGLVLNAGGAGGGGGGSSVKVGSLTVTTPPTKTSYLAGESFDGSGMVVEASYMIGSAVISTAEVTGYAVTPSVLTDGTTEVTITYTEGGVTVSATQAVTVTHRLESISVTTQPTKTTYEYTDTFDSAGMAVQAEYSDGATANVTGYTLSPTSLTTLGSQDITVSYTENGVTKTTTLTVTVERKSISATPSQSGTLTYTGSAQSPSWTGYSATQLTLGGVTSGTNAGSYNATFTPTDNYRWSDGTTGAKTVAWSIGKAAGSLSLSPTSLTLDSSSLTKTITVTRAGDGAVSAVSSNTGVAAVSVSGTTVTVTAVASGSATITVSVAEGTNYTAPANKTASVTVEMVSSTLANNTPATIQAVAAAGNGASYWSVGDKIGINVNGTFGNLTFNAVVYAFILGFNHNETYEGKGIDFQFGKTSTGVDIAWVQDYEYAGTGFCMNYSDTNSGGWDSSIMRNTICPAFLSALPSEWQNVIKAATKCSDNTGGSDTASYVTFTSDKIWLLAEFEVHGARSYANSAEQNYQKQYDYYKNGNSKVKYQHIAYGDACFWWLRSVRATSTVDFCIVYPNGAVSRSDANYSFGFAPGFKVA